jgi:arylsulfatase A-like enzyme
MGDRGLTPHIDELARKSIVFTRAFSNGPGTNQSFPAILTSTYFFMHGGMRLLPYYTALAEVLRSHGFRTVAFHSNPFLSKTLGWSKGFDEFYDFMDIIKGPSAFITRQQSRSLVGKIIRFSSTVLRVDSNVKLQSFLTRTYYRFSRLQIPYLDGEELNSHVISWMENNVNEKFFLWIHYMDSHYPYVPPERYLPNSLSRKDAFYYNLSANYENPSEKEVKIFRRLYMGGVRYVDECIGKLLGYVEDRGLMEDSLLVLTGDHGHGFMEHGRFGHAYDILYNEVLHVPLIIYGLENGNKKIDSFVQLLDVPATITDALGIRKPPSFIGESLLPVIKGEKTLRKPIFSESAKPDQINLKYDMSKKVISCIKDGWKLIFNELSGIAELYYIKDDFKEQKNIIKEEKEVFEKLKKLIKYHLFSERVLKLKQRIT